ncbi:methyltransferase domain-containing protein [Peribacillus acanthi]|uniref:methyltransferase domain-containing protein n=1 Tax=Peribacillus acanthi TaxID=2171554 RepID=UPI000D3E5927|nr:methyltransferase domain-containing protein [Peribacillus acanthi]
MRIGKFGEANKLSIDTIRHYMDLGLIVPEKKGGQYYFDGRCQNDLELILEYKAMGFSLNEIKMIFLYKKIGKFTDYEKDTYYQSLFLDKYEKLEQEINNLVKSKDKLTQKLEDISVKSAESSSMMGIDLKVLDILKCLNCSESLTLQAGMISRNQILEGKLTCNCGEEYSIESGILSIGKPFQSIAGISFENNIPEYIHETDPGFLENLNIGLHWAKRKLGQVDLHNKVLLELGTGAGFFLRNIYQELPEDCLYIAVDRNLERHRFLKSVLEKIDIKRRVLFICTDFLDIPIQNHSVDMVIDQSGTSNYSFSHEKFLLLQVDSLVKPDGYLLGSYFGFENFSHKSKIEPKYRDNFSINKIQKNIRELKYIILEDRTSESIDKGGRYEDFFVQGEVICTYTCFGKR